MKQEILVENSPRVKQVKLGVNVPEGACYVRPAPSPNLLSVYSAPTMNGSEHVFFDKKNLINEDQTICLHLDQRKNRSPEGYNVSQRFFGLNDPNSNSFWTLYLTEHKTYRLDFNCGIGDASIDLSGLSVDRLKIKTSSADVNTFFRSNEQNRSQMDTFLIKVGMGTVNARQLNLARPQTIVADVGFGSLLLDLSGQMLADTQVRGNLGSGRMLVLLPDKNIPIRVSVKRSFLCALNVPDYLKEIADDIFVNEAYLAKKNHTMTSCDIQISASVGFVTLR